MSDDERIPEESPDDERREQSARTREDERNRAHEEQAMSGDPSGRLGDLDAALETQAYPITTDELAESYCDYEIETKDGTEPLRTVLSNTEDQTFDSADDVRSRLLGLIHR